MRLHTCDYDEYLGNWDCIDMMMMMMIIRDAWLIAVANSLTSIFAGFVVFGTLGMLAQVIRIL